MPETIMNSVTAFTLERSVILKGQREHGKKAGTLGDFNHPHILYTKKNPQEWDFTGVLPRTSPILLDVAVLFTWGGLSAAYFASLAMQY